MLTYYYRTLRDDVIKEIEAPRAGVWIHIDRLTEKEIDILAEKHHIDKGLLVDANDFFEVPRFEHHGTTSYFFARYPAVDEKTGETITMPILIAVGDSFVLTATLGKPAFFKYFFEQGSRYIDIYTTQKTKFFIQLMQTITSEYTRSFITIRRDVRGSRVPLDKISEKEIEQFIQYENTVNDFISALVPANIALSQMRLGNYLELRESDVDSMQDMVLANGQLVENGKALLKSIQNIKNAYSSIMTTRLNTTVRTLTALTILLTIPTIVSSLFGMNVALPFRDHPLAFWAIISIIMILGGAGAYLFARNKWM